MHLYALQCARKTLMLCAGHASVGWLFGACRLVVFSRLERVLFVPAPTKLPRRYRCRHRTGMVRLFTATISIAAALGVAACAVGPDYTAPEPPLPRNFVAARGAGNEQRADQITVTTKWWRTLHDRELDSLIDRAIAGSPSLEIALQRLQQARAQEGG